MKKKRKKRINKKNFLKRKNTSSGIIPVLFIVALLALFSESVRTMPAGAFSEKLIQKGYSSISDIDIISVNSLRAFEIQKLNSEIIEKKTINKSFLVSKNSDYKGTKDKDKVIISKTNIIAKAPEIIIQETNTKILDEDKIADVTVDTPKIEENIKMAEDTENKLKEILRILAMKKELELQSIIKILLICRFCKNQTI